MSNINLEDEIEFIVKVNGETVSISLEELSNLLQNKKQIFNRYMDIPNNFDGICKVIDKAATYYYKNGKLHRADGPAIEWSNGSKCWYINGECHRTDGPATDDVGGYKEWRINGKLHRVDGPAVENVGGYKEWWFNGQLYRKEFTNETWMEFIKSKGMI
jgi:hypothetical protein